MIFASVGYSFSRGTDRDQACANEEHKSAQEVPGEQRQAVEQGPSVHDQQHADDRQNDRRGMNLPRDHRNGQQRQDERSQAPGEGPLHAVRGVRGNQRPNLLVAVAQESAELSDYPGDRTRRFQFGAQSRLLGFNFTLSATLPAVLSAVATAAPTSALPTLPRTSG